MQINLLFNECRIGWGVIGILSNVKLQTKLMISFSLIIILTILSVIVFLYNSIFIKIKGDITYNNLQLCIKISENIDTYIEKIDDITKKLISNTVMKNILEEANSSTTAPSEYKQLMYNRELADIISDTITLTSFPLLNVYIFSETEKYVYVYNQESSNLSYVMKDSNNIRLLNDKQMIIFPANEYLEGYDGMDAVSFVRTVFDVNGKKYGHVEVQDGYSEFHKICNIGNTGEVIIINDRNQILYSTNNNMAIGGFLLEKSRDQLNGVFEDDIGNIFFYSSCEYSGLKTFVKYDPQPLFSSLSLLRKVTYIVLGIVMLVSLALVFLFSKLLVKPLRNLRNSVLQVNYKNMGLTADSIKNNEVLLLRDAFQYILDELKISVEKEITSSKAEAKARFAALQAQIAPHFIHNVLYTISISAQENRTNDAVTMCKQLSDMLRYTVNSSFQTVRLEDEIKCISNYLSLQFKNYEDFLFYDIKVQNETKAIAIPRLSIQPFVENAIQHGFKDKKPPNRILIVAEMKGYRWSISIIDNGNGIEKSKIDQIYKRIEENFTDIELVKEEKKNSAGMGGMGIINSVMRLKMVYGSTFSFSIGINDDGGTTVCLEGDYDDKLLNSSESGGGENI